MRFSFSRPVPPPAPPKIDPLRQEIARLGSEAAVVAAACSTIADGHRKQIELIDASIAAADEIVQSLRNAAPQDSQAVLFSSAIEQSRQMTSASKGVSDAITTLAQSAQLLSNEGDGSGTAIAQVATTIEEIARSLDPVRRQADATAAAADKTSQVITGVVASTQQVTAHAEHAGAMLGKLVTGVESITRDAREAASRAADRAKSIEANGESSAAPRELGRRVAEIGVIVETVNTLAERTNLLSLNAAIEGAHAGDAGRGFVVIAEELRALSERAARAVHDVTSLIHGLNSVVQDAVDAVVDAERRAAMASTEVRDLSVATAAHADALLVLSQSATEARRAAEELARSSANQAHATQEALTTAQHAVTAANEVRTASAAQASSISDLERSGDVARRAAASTSRRLKEHASSAAQAAMDAQTLARNGSDVEAALATAVDETTTQRAQIVAADEQRAVGVEGVARTLTELRALTLRTARTANDSSMVSAALQQRVTSLS